MVRAYKKPKAKPPAFQFYPGDFMTGTMTMSLAEVGGYWRLLCHQWESGSVPADDTTALARAMVCERAEAAAIWPVISSKFSRSSRDGLWRNSRLESERRKQQAFSKLQSRKGKRGGRPKSPGLAPANPRPKPEKSSSSSIFGSQVQDTPQPPADAGGRKPSTRSERKRAEARLREFRFAHPPISTAKFRELEAAGKPVPEAPTCMHVPCCADRERCIRLLVDDERAAERRAS